MSSIQSRVRAFEARSTAAPPDLLESPISPAASAFHPIAPTSLARKSSLGDLKDWIVEDVDQRPPLPPRKPSNTVSPGSHVGAMPRRDGALTIEHTYPPRAPKFGAGRVGHAPASSISSFHSVSLSSDGTNIETRSPKLPSQPPLLTFDADSSIVVLDTASIAESFENVSVPSAVSPSTAIPFDWEQAIAHSKTPPKREPPAPPHRSGIKIPPAIPPKPLARSISTSSSSTATSTKTRRPPPPPPYQPRSRPSSSRASVVSTSASTSDRSSILSSATTTSRTSTSTRQSAQIGAGAKSSPLQRPTPVPPAARSRYESLFNSAVQGQRTAEKTRKIKSLSPPPLSANKGGQAAGWRYLSVDLVTNPGDHPMSPLRERLDKRNGDDDQVDSGERLNGRIVKHIWSASRLDDRELRGIWNDCDPKCTGSIDCDAFVRGMWRIDEELRRAQLARRTSALAAASSQRIPHRPLPLPKPLLT